MKRVFWFLMIILVFAGAGYAMRYYTDAVIVVVGVFTGIAFLYVLWFIAGELNFPKIPKAKFNIMGLIRNYQDKRLSEKLVKRLKSIDKEQWAGIWNELNCWRFPVRFRELTPRWFFRGDNNGLRFRNVTKPALDVIKEELSDYELSYNWNVSGPMGTMSHNHFEYWFYNIRSNHENIPLEERMVIIRNYINRERFIQNLEWWKGDVFEKIQAALDPGEPEKDEIIKPKPAKKKPTPKTTARRKYPALRTGISKTK